jgi:hypothetical protein
MTPAIPEDSGSAEAAENIRRPSSCSVVFVSSPARWLTGRRRAHGVRRFDLCLVPIVARSTVLSCWCWEAIATAW